MMAKVGYKQISVKEDTYQLFQKFRGLLFMREGRKVTEDEAVRRLLEYAMPREISEQT